MNEKLTLRAVAELAFGDHGGAELFFADLNADSRPDILAYQGPGVFGTAMYANWPHVKPAFPRSVCLTAFDHEGRRMWTWGKPNPADKPYVCHAHESCVAAGDADGDGRPEVALADGEAVHLLDGLTGEVRAAAALPQDNFYIVQILGEPTRQNEAALVVKNGEGGYDSWRYGEPLIALNSRLKTVWGPTAIPGAGHHILSTDLDGDGRREYLVGYCAVKPDGRLAWTLEGIDPAALNADKDHVDYTDLWGEGPDERLLAFAGSSRAYLACGAGRLLFSHPGPHVQGCALGRFGRDGKVLAAFYNDDGPMVLYDLQGRELWQRPTPILWPLGEPRTCRGRVFHRNRPVVVFPHKDRDWLIVSDGGWPYGMDGDGEISLEFEPPPNSRQPECDGLPDRARADDVGYGFATKVLDWDGDGVPEAVVYDRRRLWVFKPVP